MTPELILLPDGPPIDGGTLVDKMLNPDNPKFIDFVWDLDPPEPDTLQRSFARDKSVFKQEFGPTTGGGGN